MESHKIYNNLNYFQVKSPAPHQKAGRLQPRQMGGRGRQIRAVRKPGGVPCARGAGGDRPDPDPLPRPGAADLCAGQHDRVHPPVHRRPLGRRDGAARCLPGRGAGMGAQAAGDGPAHLGRGQNLLPAAEREPAVFLAQTGV